MSLSTTYKYFLNTFRVGDSTTSVGRPLQLLTTVGEGIFLNIQPESPQKQCEALPTCPISSYLGEEADAHLAAASFQTVGESSKVSPEPPLLQTEQSQFPQPLLIRLVLLMRSFHLSCLIFHERCSDLAVADGTGMARDSDVCKQLSRKE